MYKGISVEAEHNELILQNTHGDYVIVPSEKRDWVKSKIKEGCHSCIDSLVERLPIASQYAEFGGIYPKKSTTVNPTTDGEEVEFAQNGQFDWATQLLGSTPINIEAKTQLNNTEYEIPEIDRFAKEYVMSPQYETMLTKMGYSPEEIKKRKESVTQFNTDNDIIYSSDENSFVQDGRVTIGTDKGDWPSWADIISHEYGHIEVDDTSSPLKDREWEELIYRNKSFSPTETPYESLKKSLMGDNVLGLDENTLHDLHPQENRSDLFQLRYQLDKKKIYNPTKDGLFKKEHLEKLKESGEWNRLFRQYSDEDVIWLMNNIASNNTNESNNKV